MKNQFLHVKTVINEILTDLFILSESFFAPHYLFQIRKAKVTFLAL